MTLSTVERGIIYFSGKTSTVNHVFRNRRITLDIEGTIPLGRITATAIITKENTSVSALLFAKRVGA